jgi:hypothetical protein
MHPEGYWVEPGPGYNPKYFSTVWALVLLAQLGASVRQDERIEQACGYILDHALTDQGQFSASGLPSGTADCLHGNLCWALAELGVDLWDVRLERAFDWLARSVTGEGVAPQSQKDAPLRFYAGKCGPGFLCGANDRLPCAWGATKVALALSKARISKSTPQIATAVQAAVDFLFSVDPATAAYPSGYSGKPSGSWWKFGFPVFYITDLLQVAEALTALGCGSDPRLGNLFALIESKRGPDGRWPLEYNYSGKTWVEFGEKKKPNKWVTIRALRVRR